MTKDEMLHYLEPIKKSPSIKGLFPPLNSREKVMKLRGMYNSDFRIKGVDINLSTTNLIELFNGTDLNILQVLERDDRKGCLCFHNGILEIIVSDKRKYAEGFVMTFQPNDKELFTYDNYSTPIFGGFSTFNKLKETIYRVAGIEIKNTLSDGYIDNYFNVIAKE